MHSIESLESTIAMIPIFKTAVPAELSIAICDTEKFLAYWPGENIDLHIRIGQRLHQEEPLMQAIQNNVALRAEVPSEFYGFEFIGTATPLHDSSGRVIGGIAVQLRKQTELISFPFHYRKPTISSRKLQIARLDWLGLLMSFVI